MQPNCNHNDNVKFTFRPFLIRLHSKCIRSLLNSSSSSNNNSNEGSGNRNQNLSKHSLNWIHAIKSLVCILANRQNQNMYSIFRSLSLSVSISIFNPIGLILVDKSVNFLWHQRIIECKFQWNSTAQSICVCVWMCLEKEEFQRSDCIPCNSY